jgi:hypothetical protein
VDNHRAEVVGRLLLVLLATRKRVVVVACGGKGRDNGILRDKARLTRYAISDMIGALLVSWYY